MFTCLIISCQKKKKKKRKEGAHSRHNNIKGTSGKEQVFQMVKGINAL